MSTSQQPGKQSGGSLAWALLAVLCAFLFFWRLGAAPLFDLDEGVYASAAKQMALHGDWITPKLNSRLAGSSSPVTPFFEKPILIYWLAAGSMRALGVHHFALRLPAALAALASVALVALASRAWFGNRSALLAAFSFATAPVTLIDARQLTTDGLLVLWIDAALLCYAAARAGGRWRVPAALGFWLSASLGVLTKGAVGLLLPLMVIVVYEWLNCLALRAGVRGRRPSLRFLLRLEPLRDVAAAMRCLEPLPGLLLLVAMCLPWHLLVWRAGGRDELGHTWFQEYILRQHIGRFRGLDRVHDMPLPTYVLYFLVGFFPWACWTPAALLGGAALRLRSPIAPARAPGAEPPQEEPAATPGWRHTSTFEPRRYLLVWFWTIFVFFSLAAAKLPTYIAPAYPAAAILLGAWLESALKGSSEWVRSLRRGTVAAAVTALLLVSAAIAAPRLAPKNAPIPSRIQHLALDVSLLLAIGCGGALLSLILPGERGRKFWLACLATMPVALLALGATEGYAVARSAILGPYQQTARDADTDAATGIPVVYYHIIPRRPSMLYYARYSPYERKEAPLLPFVRTALPGAVRVDVVTSRAVLDNLLAPEVAAAPGSSLRVLAEHEAAGGGWVLVRVDPGRA